MIRKIIQNGHQYKVNIPIELVRRLNLKDKVQFKLINTSKGEAIILMKYDEEEMKI